MPTRRFTIGFAVLVAIVIGTGVALTSPALAQPDGENATVSVADQATDGEEVEIDSVTLPEGGYVVIHNQSLAEGDPLASTIGVSEYLAAGVHENVTVELYDVPGADLEADELPEDETLIAMAHRDTDGNEAFGFVDSAGAEDGPYIAGGEAVVDEAAVTVDGEDEPAEEEPEETPAGEDVDDDDDEEEEEEEDGTVDEGDIGPAEGTGGGGIVVIPE